MKNRPADIILENYSPFSNEEALSIILNNLDEVFILVNKQLQIIHTTESTKEKVKKNWGINITGQTSILELVAKERWPMMQKLYEDVFGGIEKETIVELPTLDKPLIFETHFRPAKNSKGEIIGAVIIAKDVTEKKRAENSLKETEERWRFALEGGNQGVWDWNVQTGDIFFSDSYKRLYGYGPNDLKGRIEEWEKMIHPEDRKLMELAIEDHLSSSDPCYESTYRVKTKGGDYKWVIGRGMLIRDNEGRPLRMIGTHTDITKRVIAEQTYKVLFYSNPLPMWTYDLETLRFLSVNDAAISHYGYSKEEFLSMTIKDIRHEEKVEQLMEWVEKRKTVGHIKRVSQHLKKNGEHITVELSTHRFDDSNTVLVVAQDITSKIKAEEELKQGNERFLYASRATSDAIYEWDILTNEVYWGEGIQTLFGFNPKEVSFAVWESLIHSDDRDRILDSIQSALQRPKRKLWKAEYRFAKKDGSFRYVLDRGFIIRDENHNALRIIGSLQDITERKYSEQILSLERSVFELSNKTDIDLEYLVQTLLAGFEEIHEDAFTSLILLREDNTIEPFVAPRLPNDYTEKLFGLKIGPEEGSCGAAMWRKQTVIVEDISSHPFWAKYKTLALHFGLHSCWSLPIIHTSGKVMGSFAVYYKTIKGPSTIELNTLERIRNIIRILMEYHWSLNEIKKANEQFDIVMKATHDLIWDWDLQANTVSRSALGLEKVYGIKDNKLIEKVEQWLSHVHEEDTEKIRKIISNILQNKTENTFEVEYRFKKDNGTYSYVYDRGMVLRNKEGKPVRLIGAAQDITERKHLEEELLRTELEKQKAINQASIDSQEKERTEIGKELHDNVNQILTTTKLYLDLALSNNELKDELIAKSNKNIISVINEIRQLSRSLMDPTIGDLGLIDSINDLIESINLTRKLQVNLVADRKLEPLLCKNYKLTVFRIIQEALNNAIKYAKAATVEINLKLYGNNMMIIIKDDGVGFDPASVKMGAGLKNIQNRVYLVNGTYTIQTSPGKGCKIIINFPLIK
jgi:PAS domain S-box-containing protein